MSRELTKDQEFEQQFLEILFIYQGLFSEAELKAITDTKQHQTFLNARDGFLKTWVDYIRAADWEGLAPKCCCNKNCGKP